MFHMICIGTTGDDLGNANVSYHSNPLIQVSTAHQLPSI